MNELEAATIELDALDDSSEIIKSGFILKYYQSQVQLDRERVIGLVDTSLAIKDVTLSAMIGLYALKDHYSTVEVNVYNARRYTFELQKYAIVNKEDFVKVHLAISEAFKSITNNNQQVCDIVDNILLDIQQDRFKFEE